MKKMNRLLVLLLSATFGFTIANSQAATPVQKVYFENLKDGQTIQNGFIAKFAVKGMKVQPAGELKKNTGHHHLIIDGQAPAKGEVVPADDKHIHFGKGQTEFKLENLTPGEHTLTLQFADGHHQSYGPKFSAQVKVKVE